MEAGRWGSGDTNIFFADPSYNRVLLSCNYGNHGTGRKWIVAELSKTD